MNKHVATFCDCLVNKVNGSLEMLAQVLLVDIVCFNMQVIKFVWMFRTYAPDDSHDVSDFALM